METTAHQNGPHSLSTPEEQHASDVCVGGVVATLDIVQGVGGQCVVINGRRVAGPKPLGGGQVIHSFKVSKAEIETALK